MFYIVKCHHSFREHKGIVSCIKLSADERSFVSGSWDKTIKVNTYLKKNFLINIFNFQKNKKYF